MLKPGAPAVIHHANTFSELGWRKFLVDVPPSLGRKTLPTSFTVMHCRLMGESVSAPGASLKGA